MEHVNGAYGCMGDLGMHVLHVPLRLGWRPETLHANLVKRVTERPDGKGNRVPCTTWDNATISSRVVTADQDFPMVLKTWRIAPGESNTWYIRILGMKKSAFFSTKNPRQWQWMDYQGTTQSWNTEDLGYGSVFPAITGKIFEFGFADAIQQMWAPSWTNWRRDGKRLPLRKPCRGSSPPCRADRSAKSGLENRVVTVDYD